MAQILKADFSSVHHLEQQKEALDQARSLRNSRRRWFGLGAGGLLLLVGAIYLVHGWSMTTAWVIEGYLFGLALWWMIALVPAALEVHKVERQLESVRSGLMGELAVGRTLSSLPDNCLILHDVTVMSDEFNHTQVDHIVITPQIVLCIETKNWHGTYYPGKAGWMWTSLDRISRSKRQAHKDPIEQSRMHQDALQRLLDTAELSMEIQSAVVLSDPESSWQGNQSKNCPVLRREELVPYIQSLGCGSEEKASERQIKVAEAILTQGKGETTSENSGASPGGHARFK